MFYVYVALAVLLSIAVSLALAATLVCIWNGGSFAASWDIYWNGWVRIGCVY